MRKQRLTLLIVICGLALFLATGAFVSKARRSGLTGSNRISGLQNTIRWAWERPEDLSFIDTRQFGVAYLARTLVLKGDEVVVRPRLQPIKFPPEARLT